MKRWYKIVTMSCFLSFSLLFLLTIISAQAYYGVTSTPQLLTQGYPSAYQQTQQYPVTSQAQGYSMPTINININFYGPSGGSSYSYGQPTYTQPPTEGNGEAHYSGPLIPYTGAYVGSGLYGSIGSGLYGSSRYGASSYGIGTPYSGGLYGGMYGGLYGSSLYGTGTPYSGGLYGGMYGGLYGASSYGTGTPYSGGLYGGMYGGLYGSSFYSGGLYGGLYGGSYTVPPTNVISYGGDVIVIDDSKKVTITEDDNGKTVTCPVAAPIEVTLPSTNFPYTEIGPDGYPIVTGGSQWAEKSDENGDLPSFHSDVILPLNMKMATEGDNCQTWTYVAVGEGEIELLFNHIDFNSGPDCDPNDSNCDPNTKAPTVLDTFSVLIKVEGTAGEETPTTAYPQYPAYGYPYGPPSVSYDPVTGQTSYAPGPYVPNPSVSYDPMTGQPSYAPGPYAPNPSVSYDPMTGQYRGSYYVTAYLPPDQYMSPYELMAYSGGGVVAPIVAIPTGAAPTVVAPVPTVVAPTRVNSL